jgi:hypothetical protein
MIHAIFVGRELEAYYLANIEARIDHKLAAGIEITLL